MHRYCKEICDKELRIGKQAITKLHIQFSERSRELLVIKVKHNVSYDSKNESIRDGQKTFLRNVEVSSSQTMPYQRNPKSGRSNLGISVSTEKEKVERNARNVIVLLLSYCSKKKKTKQT